MTYGPADVVIEPDGTTFVRIDSWGASVLVNMDKLREWEAPPVAGYRFPGEERVRPVSMPSYFADVPVTRPDFWTSFLGGA